MSTIPDVTIRTRYASHPVTGSGRIIATGAGRKATVPTLLSASVPDNHWRAAFVLATRILGDAALIEEVDAPSSGRRVFRAWVGGEDK